MYKSFELRVIKENTKWETVYACNKKHEIVPVKSTTTSRSSRNLQLEIFMISKWNCCCSRVPWHDFLSSVETRHRIHRL